MSLLTGSEAGQAATPPQTGNPTSTNTNIDKDINGNTMWYESLPDDLKSNESIKHFKTMPDLVKSYIHAQSMVGKKGVIVPSENADSEVWEGFYTSLGRPTIDKYEFKTPEGVDPERTKAFKEMAHKAGLLPRQAQQLLENSLKMEEANKKNVAAEIERYTQEGIGELKKEWGDNFENMVGTAVNALREVGGDEMQQYIVDLGLDNDPKFVKMFAKIGKLLGEDKLRGEGGSNINSMSARELEAEYNKLHGQLLSTSPLDPQYKMLSLEVEKLAKKRWPS